MIDAYLGAKIDTYSGAMIETHPGANICSHLIAKIAGYFSYVLLVALMKEFVLLNEYRSIICDCMRCITYNV